jgi:hypothetical protein
LRYVENIALRFAVGPKVRRGSYPKKQSRKTSAR